MYWKERCKVFASRKTGRMYTLTPSRHQPVRLESFFSFLLPVCSPAGRKMFGPVRIALRFGIGIRAVPLAKKTATLSEKKTFENSDPVGFTIMPTFRLRSSSFRLRSTSYAVTRRPDKLLELTATSENIFFRPRRPPTRTSATSERSV